LNVLHVVSGNMNEGASRGAYWLHQGLRQLGINSKILTNGKTILNDENVVGVSQDLKSKIFNSLRGRLDMMPSILYRNRKKIIFSTGFVGFDFTKNQLYKDADIVHLHWINGGFVNLRHIAKIDKAIVWTMRDMWPMTGGCHVAEALQCDRYIYGCGKCKQLGSFLSLDLSRMIVNRKKRLIPKNIKLIGISDWLSEKARASYLFKKFDIRTIHNNINTNDFFPIEKQIAKDIIGIKTSKKIVLCGAINSNNFYKGFDNFVDAVSKLDRQGIYLVFFGEINEELVANLGFEYKNMGCLNDIISLRLVYSASNVFVAPSLMDAFGKTLAESLACGTPVVCFNATGPKDIVDHKINGYKAEPYDSEDLAEGINWVLNAINYEEISQEARRKVVTKFDSKVIAEKYIKLYCEILSKKC